LQLIVVILQTVTIVIIQNDVKVKS